MRKFYYFKTAQCTTDKNQIQMNEGDSELRCGRAGALRSQTKSMTIHCGLQSMAHAHKNHI